MPDQARPLHVMLDIETLGVDYNAPILEIGAVAFDPLGPDLPQTVNLGDTFFAMVDPGTCLPLGGEYDWNTIRWHFSQGETHRNRLVNGVRSHISTALMSLAQWIQTRKPHRVWAHGATFDPIILGYYYKKLRKELPWEFRSIRDTRTLFDEVRDITEEEWKQLTYKAIPHYSVDDAWAQARAVQRVKKALAAKYGEITTESVPGVPSLPPGSSGGTHQAGAHSPATP